MQSDYATLDYAAGSLSLISRNKNCYLSLLVGIGRHLPTRCIRLLITAIQRTYDIQIKCSLNGVSIWHQKHHVTRSS